MVELLSPPLALTVQTDCERLANDRQGVAVDIVLDLAMGVLRDLGTRLCLLAVLMLLVVCIEEN